MDHKVQAIYEETVQSLLQVYDESEAASIASLLFSELLSIDKMARLTNVGLELDEPKYQIWKSALTRLMNSEPLQHITGKAFFYGHEFRVNEHTLIPRPETEELVQLIVEENRQSSLAILDIGTGSGCIPISLALTLKDAKVSSIDISKKALATARENAENLGAVVDFIELNTLTEVWPMENLDIVVSNPPYILEKEKSEMHKNVVAFEPEMALFVPDHDPLLFYRQIAKQAIGGLKSGGKIYFEIHHAFGKETVRLLSDLGYVDVRLLQDLQGKDRIVTGRKG